MSISTSTVLNYLSTCVFAFSGTKVALDSRDSAIIAIIAGIVTACGGGTMRDTLNGKPPFWIHQPGYIVVSLIFAIIGYLMWKGPHPPVAKYGA